MIVPSIVWTICFGLFCGIIAIQLFYYLYFFIRLANYIPAVKENTVEHAVSVVICARDEAHNLVKNIPGILVQNYKTTHEVVLVNDNSTDESKYIIDEFKRSFKNLNLIELTQEALMISGKKFPLSMGIKSAKYEIVLGYGAYHKQPGILNKLIRFETFHTAIQYLSYSLAGKPYMGVGRNLSYKKNVFFRNKGFSSINQIPSGDDDLFINQVANSTNTAIIIDPETHTLSQSKQSWGEWMSQKYRHYTTSKYYKPIHKFLLGLYSFTLFFLYPMLIVSMIFYNWWIALIIFGFRFLIQAYVYFKAMKKLNEADLFPWFLLLDIWMFFYFILTAPALWKAPRKNWN